MSKRVVLKLDNDVNEPGFLVALEVGEEQQLPFLEERGYLPPAPELFQCLDRWQQAYQRLSDQTRIVLKNVTIQAGSLSHFDLLEACRRAARELENQLRIWLESQSFSPIDRRLREVLQFDESIRILLRTHDVRLHHLPWHAWEMMERYPKAEVILGVPIIKQKPTRIVNSFASVIRILVILGDCRGIDVDADRQLLENLTNVQVECLVEPSRQQISQQLWEQHWDILFFAGHSRTEGNKGRIYINPQEALSLSELKFGLRQAIDRGLRLAIFNSCDGLGLAYEMESLNLLQLIVMREPVPDRVAQTFLKYFLSSYAGGESFYLSVRRSRERLQEVMDHEFPCASWLPIICQSPTEISPTWEELVGDTPSRQPPHRRHSYSTLKRSLFSHLYWKRDGFRLVGLVSLATSLLVLGIRFSGNLQPAELIAFDQMMRSRPLHESVDPRILIIEVTDEDIAMQHQNGEPMQRVSTSDKTQGEVVDVSLSDRSLNQLLTILAEHQPRVIGLDILRDFAADENQAGLVDRFRSLPIIGICKHEDIEDESIPSIDPPPELVDRENLENPNTWRIGFSDFQTDENEVLRRHLLRMSPTLRSPDTLCNVSQSFSVQVAFAYLRKEGVVAEFVRWGDYDDLRLGERIFKVLRSHTGGYHKLMYGGGGSQILLNYRASDQIAERITLFEVFNNKVNPDLIRDNIVLIGVTAKDKDRWITSINDADEDIPGVIVQAHMISQLLSAALDQRPLLQTWSLWQDALWLLGWTIAGAVLTWQLGLRYGSLKSFLLRLVMTIFLLFGALYSVCLVSLIWFGIWIPFIPVVLAVTVSSSVMTLYFVYSSQQSHSSSTNS